MFQEALFYARIKNIARDREVKETVEKLMQWANTDERARRLVHAMCAEMNRVEALTKPTRVKVEVPTDGRTGE